VTISRQTWYGCKSTTFSEVLFQPQVLSQSHKRTR
jgi:hypothetical protein